MGYDFFDEVKVSRVKRGLIYCVVESQVTVTHEILRERERERLHEHVNCEIYLAS